MLDEKILNFLKSHARRYTPIKQIADVLGKDLENVQAEINKLKQQGYVFSCDSVDSAGGAIRLEQIPDRLIPYEIKSGLNTEIIGSEIYSFEVVDSTMDVARDLACKNAKNGSVVLAESQRCGRGRSARSWVSPSGKGLYFSIILKPSEKIMDLLPWVTLLVGVSVAEVIRSNIGLDALIKWPNDVLVSGKKVCGILTEKITNPESKDILIVGVGINANHSDSNVKLPENATSLQDECHDLIDRIELLKNILRKIESNYLILNSGDIDLLKQKWEKLSNIIGRRILVEFSNKNKIEVYAVGLAPSGALIVRFDNGFIQNVFEGDVTLVR